jgi:hypothetical protein
VYRHHHPPTQQSRDASAVARTGVAALSRICQLEFQLFNSFFGEADMEVGVCVRAWLWVNTHFACL